MIGKTPLTRESLLKLLELPENADLKKSLEEHGESKEIVFELVLAADQAFDSCDEFKSAINAYEMKNRSREDTLAGTEAIV